MTAPSTRVRALRVSASHAAETSRVVPEETPVALVYDGATHAVMMATPADLEDFAIGFSLTEGVVESKDEIAAFESVEHENGVELRMWLEHGAGRAAAERRRRVVGPTGCGLCGVDSLAAAAQAPRRVADGGAFTRADVEAALEALAPAQTLNRETRAVHGAGFWSREKGLVALREDVGRHNALDKLAGALARTGMSPASGLILLTSRVSVEMVQKSAAIGAPVVVAISAPTALALRMAGAAGITLVAVARADAFEVFTHPSRLLPPAPQPARQNEPARGPDADAA